MLKFKILMINHYKLCFYYLQINASCVLFFISFQTGKGLFLLLLPCVLCSSGWTVWLKPQLYALHFWSFLLHVFMFCPRSMLLISWKTVSIPQSCKINAFYIFYKCIFSVVQIGNPSSIDLKKYIFDTF